MSLTPVQNDILRKMYYERRYMTIREIAYMTGYSWQTIEKHIIGLHKKRFVMKQEKRLKTDLRKKKIKWKFNYRRYKKLMTKKK